MTEPDYLRKNLDALVAVDPSLAARLCWPVSSQHVRLEGDRVFYRFHQTELRLDLTPSAVDALVGAIPADLPCFVFGIGLGEILAALLPGCEAAVTAWERDPWLLRLALTRNDLSSFIHDGTLRLALSADLLGITPISSDAALVEHPVLRYQYKHERQLLWSDASGPVAWLAEGGLLVDDVARALSEEGYRVLLVDLQLLSKEELDWMAIHWNPALLATINYTQGLGDFCAQHAVPLLCWEIDPAEDDPRLLQSDPGRLHVFTYNRANIEAFRAAGFTNVEYLPIAADPDTRRPVTLTDEERERYAAPVSFVGSSLSPERDFYERKYFLMYEEFRPGAREEARAILEAVLAEQALNWSTYAIPGMFALLSPEIPHELGRTLARCAGEISAARRRWDYVARLLPLGLRVWGDDGWLQTAGAAYQGPAGHIVELNRVYQGSIINLDVNRLYQTEIVPIRIFDVLATGSFVLAEHSSALEELFVVGVEVDSYRDADEMEAKVRHYLAHPDEAAAIAERGRAAVLARHTVRQRVRHMLGSVSR